jgi:hypothetical protein
MLRSRFVLKFVLQSQPQLQDTAAVALNQPKMAAALAGPVIQTGAVMSPDGNHRDSLIRVVLRRTRRVAFVMRNPSTADATRDDNTVRLCNGLGRRWGFGHVEIVNLGTVRSGHGATRDEELEREVVASALMGAAKAADIVVLAWGDKKLSRSLRERIPLVYRTLRRVARGRVYCLAWTKTAQPRSICRYPDLKHVTRDQLLAVDL